jgi:hypothetical protein
MRSTLLDAIRYLDYSNFLCHFMSVDAKAESGAGHSGLFFESAR